MPIAIFAVLVTLLAAPAVSSAGAPGTAESFLRQLQRGDVERAKRLLDDPRYRSEPRGGTNAYFTYESGYEPNLAFLVGQPFVVGRASETTQRSDWYLLDGTLYATVTLPLTFAADDRRPWVLPLSTAFGRPMAFADFLKFAADPERYPQHLTLRFRRGLGPGRVRRPAPTVAPLPPAPPGASAMAGGVDRPHAYGSLLGPRPADPAPIRLPSGEALSVDQLHRFLPRLTAITVDVSLVRRGRFASWSVTRWTFRDAVIATEKGHVPVIVGPQP